MARQSRAERRARRLAQQGEPVVAADGGAKPPVSLPTAREEPGEPRRGRGSFVRESIGELRKVEWPGQNQVIQGTVVVLIAGVIIGTYLYAADQVFRRLVENVLLGQ